MKKNLLKRIGAVALAVAVSMTMGVTSFAAVNDNTGTIGTSVTFTDTFTISEGDEAKNLPAATFDYAIAVGSGKAASDSNPLIKAGVAGATISAAAHNATASGTTSDNVDVTADFSNCGFTSAGIYRYNITETLGTSSVADDIAIDIKNANKGTYVLDVYVKKDGSNFVPYAYIMSKDGSITEYKSSDNPQTVKYADKVDTITNEYTTYNLTISKTIVGDMAANDFAFTINIAGVPADVIFTQDGTDETGVPAGQTLAKTLATGESTEIKGLPSTATYAIQEAVNKAEGYEVTVEDNNANAGTYAWIGTDAYGNSTATTLGKADTAVGFTNTLNSISPTNVVMRFAPYLFILGAAIVLLVMMRRRKARNAE